MYKNDKKCQISGRFYLAATVQRYLLKLKFVTKMALLIYKLDCNTSDEGPICILNNGQHIIGRGELLKCNDKRASRAHAVIKINNGQASITSIHQNPCFFQSAHSKTVIILPRDVSTDLTDGDKFGIFPDQFWFKIKVENTNAKEDTKINTCHTDDNGNNEQLNMTKLDDHSLLSASSESTTSNNVEADLPNESVIRAEAPVRHTIKEELSDSDTENEVLSSAIAKERKIVIGNNQKEVSREDSAQSSRTELLSDSECENDFHSVKLEQDDVVTEIDTTNTESINRDTLTSAEQPSCSGTNEETVTTLSNGDEIVRERCWYSGNCYRKSVNHKKEFSHPGDSDYDGNPSDSRPVCKFGVQCYRKNEDHRKMFKHSAPTGKPLPKGRRRSKRDVSKKRKLNTNESPTDDYDYEDPFLNDDSEDEYEEEPWSESDDSDE